MGLCFLSRAGVNLRGHVCACRPAGAFCIRALGNERYAVGSVVWVLLQHRIDYASVLAVLLIAAVAGVIAHVPAGLGVLEAVFIALLSHRIPETELLAALLAYRAIYYLMPLALASGLLVTLEAGRATSDHPLEGHPP